LQGGIKSGDGQKPHSRTHGRRERQRKTREEKRREGKRAAVNNEGSEQWRSTTKFSTVL